MSSNLENAAEALQFDEEPVFEALKPSIDADQAYLGRLSVLHEMEDLAWGEVERGKRTAQEAEEAIWVCVEWVESDEA